MKKPTEWENIYIWCDQQRLFCKIYKEFIPINIKTKTTQSIKWAEDLTDISLKKTDDGQKHMKKDTEHH